MAWECFTGIDRFQVHFYVDFILLLTILFTWGLSLCFKYLTSNEQYLLRISNFRKLQGLTFSIQNVILKPIFCVRYILLFNWLSFQIEELCSYHYFEVQQLVPVKAMATPPFLLLPSMVLTLAVTDEP